MSTIENASDRDSVVKVVVVLVLLFTSIYMWIVDNGIGSTPRDAERLVSPRWTKDQITTMYKKVSKKSRDMKPYLFSKKNRRYIVTGGSGLVGGWIVNHLLQRGEDPRAIRILDMRAPTRPEATDGKVSFIEVDVSDSESVREAFLAPWDPETAKLPLTVFHTVAYINPAERNPVFMPLYLKINVEGTRHVISAAKEAKVSVLIATSSGSIAVRPPKFFFAPWKSAPGDFFQLSVNADPRNPRAPLQNFSSCYAYSKALAENIVLEADDKKGMRTGTIRPAHAIYGHGVKNTSSIVYDYMRRGGTPSWIPHVVANFVSAQNVSIAHLAYENTFISKPDTEHGGNGYCCTDPNKPIRFRDLYELCDVLGHPTTPVSFPHIPPLPILLLAYMVEAYALLQHRFLTFLPAPKGDIAMVQPAMLNMSTVHIAYDDSAAGDDIGYKTPLTTLEGMCQQLKFWNDAIEENLEEDSDEDEEDEEDEED